MKDLTAYIHRRLEMCHRAPNDLKMRETFYAQAFGALDFYNETHPELWPQIEKLWIEYRPQFEKIVYKIP